MKQLWFCSNITNTSSGALKDLSHITYFNCDKKGYYATKCPKPRKDRETLEDQRYLKRLVTSLGNLRIDGTNVDSTQEATLKRVPQTSSAHPVPYHLPRESVLALLNSENVVHAQRSSRLRRKAIPMTYKLNLDIKSLSIPTSALSLPCHNYIRVPHLSYDYYIFSSSRHALSID